MYKNNSFFFLNLYHFHVIYEQKNLSYFLMNDSNTANYFSIYSLYMTPLIFRQEINKKNIVVNHLLFASRSIETSKLPFNSPTMFFYPTFFLFPLFLYNVIVDFCYNPLKLKNICSLTSDIPLCLNPCCRLNWPRGIRLREKSKKVKKKYML